MLARIQDDRPARQARPGFPGAGVSEAADQFHLVGESQRRRRQEPVRRRLPRPRQYRRVRPFAAAADRQASWSRPTAPPGWRSTARRCWRWRWSWRARTRPTRTSHRSSSSISSQSGRDEHARRHRAVGRGGRLLLRQADAQRAVHSAQDPLDGRVDSAASRSRCWTTTCSTSCRAFCKRMRWFLENRPDLARQVSYMEAREGRVHTRRLLAIPSRERLERVLRYLLDENEFLSPYGIRSLSRIHREHPYVFHGDGRGISRRVRSRRNRTPGCSAATRTGADRSGSRLTICWSRRSSAITISTAILCESNVQPVPDG